MKKISVLTILLGLTATINAQCFDKIITSSFHNLTIKSDKTLWSWGLNQYGQIGNGTLTSPQLVPFQVGSGIDWEIAAGENHSLATKNGTLLAWGQNTYGQLGDGTGANQTMPIQIGNDTDWIRVIAGSYSSYAVKSNGTLWAWGNNGSGRLGDGTITTRTTPVQITNATNWKKVVAGNAHTLAIKTDGTLWSWGNNGSGRLGLGASANNVYVPTQVGSSTDWIDIAAGGSQSLAIKANHTLWAWGDNNYGQLGDGTNTLKSTPTQIGTDTDWESVAAGGSHSLAKKSNGTLWSSGRNVSGQLGNGTTINQNTFVQIGNSSDWTIVTAGTEYSAALKNDGSLWTWGDNIFGQLGDGTQSTKTVPTMINCPQSMSVIDSNEPFEKLSIYPNPTKDIVNLDNLPKNATIKITDATGKLVYTSISKNTNLKINTEKFAKGIYFLKVNGNGKTSGKKLIINK